MIKKHIVDVAATCIGTVEGTDRHKTIIDIYNGYDKKTRPYKMRMTDPWCAAFVSAVFIASGVPDLLPIECSCHLMKKAAKDRGQLMDPKRYVPEPGDVILYKMPGKDVVSHTGIVSSVKGSSLEVIEGNYRDKVGIRKIKLSYKYIDSYIRIKDD